MSTLGLGFPHYIAEADKYYRTGAWEEASIALDAAEVELPQSGRDDALLAMQRRRGEIERRKGNYNKARKYLEESIQVNGDARGIRYLELVGELGAILINQDLIFEARDHFQQQLRIAEALSQNATVSQNRALRIAVEAQICRAVGNLGLAKYHIATTAQVRRKPLLYQAVEDLEKRVATAEALLEKLEQHDDIGGYQFTAGVWRSLGLGRLTLCYTALGEHDQALQYGRAAVESAATSSDPTIQGISRFYYGNALLAAGLRDQARAQWDFATDRCTSVIALCKEPSEEHCRYLRKMRSVGVRFDRHDEKGYSALDYAVLAGHEKFSAIVIRGLRDEMDIRYPEDEAKADRQVEIRRAEANRRKQYREMFQSTFRPLLGAHMPNTSTENRLLSLRRKYAHDLKMD